MMKDNRKNLDCYFLGYKKKSRAAYVIPLLIGLLGGAFGAVLYTNRIPGLTLDPIYSYVIFGVAGLILLAAIAGFITGTDKTKTPSTAEVENYLKEDVESVRENLAAQLSPDFRPGDTREFVVVNHCHGDVDGFHPYFKKDERNTLHCSLNKITFFTFGPRRMQIYTAVVDLFTGIDIRQSSIKIPYSDIFDCYIAYNSVLRPESLVYEQPQSKDKRKRSKQLPKLVQAVKACREVLRIRTRTPDEADSGKYYQDFHDIMVADFEVFHTKNGIYKNIYTVNDGKSVEREILRRIGRVAVPEQAAKPAAEDADFRFVDDFNEAARNTPIEWS